MHDVKASEPWRESIAALSLLAQHRQREGQEREAERLLRPSLEGLLLQARVGGPLPPGDVQLATNLALRWAELHGAADWLSYVFDLCAAACTVPEPEVVERLRVLASRIDGLSVASFRSCTDRLDELEGQLDLRQRRSLQCLHQLESAIVSSFLTSREAARLAH